MKKSYSDRYLMKLWRYAVLAEYGGCIFCGNGNQDELECHHIVKRRIKILRWDWKNGVPLCKFGCHGEAHTKLGEQRIIQSIGLERWNYIITRENIIHKVYLLNTHQSDNEYRKSVAQELKRKINES